MFCVHPVHSRTRGKQVDIREYIDDVARSVAFLSRIRVPQRHFDGHDGRLNRTVRAFPVAGLLIVLPAAALLSILEALGAASLFAAFLVLAVQTLLTGALHEDGLSDAADGLGGGRDRDSALTIMKDSRVGSYGVVALILSFGLRTSALAGIIPLLSPIGAAMVLLAVAAASRAAMVWHWSTLPPARKDGVAASAGQPDPSAVQAALLSGAAIAVLFLLPNAPLLTIASVALAIFAAVFAFTDVVRDKIGGNTGDTIGATEQVAEIAALCALALAL
ncbi:adenosylcobinamide-GDP ribazoletransferase [Rhizobium sp. ARZ01]|uniref:adenosylcobinamide-GDP ribazoletransferase n=1 Tax=Rhizobium sp. ARZ01 TaxID=2769313 RepID=UPI001783F27D|nr:adenosylcobinamide-GDP ribazoletransferase [Rhizobium sp. ARZ01]MBD9372199.1 adenosylcobinamide-GDP ribazoletransferase [Rhizobium sp. ARZ01]